MLSYPQFWYTVEVDRVSIHCWSVANSVLLLTFKLFIYLSEVLSFLLPSWGLSCNTFLSFSQTWSTADRYIFFPYMKITKQLNPIKFSGTKPLYLKVSNFTLLSYSNVYSDVYRKINQKRTRCKNINSKSETLQILKSNSDTLYFFIPKSDTLGFFSIQKLTQCICFNSISDTK